MGDTMEVHEGPFETRRLRHRRYVCTLCGHSISVAHVLRHLEAHRRQAVIDQASIRREWQRFRESEESV